MSASVLNKVPNVADSLVHTLMDEGMSALESVKDSEFTIVNFASSYHIRLGTLSVDAAVTSADSVVVQFHHLGVTTGPNPAATFEIWAGDPLTLRGSVTLNLNTSAVHKDHEATIPLTSPITTRSEIDSLELHINYTAGGGSGDDPDPYAE